MCSEREEVFWSILVLLCAVPIYLQTVKNKEEELCKLNQKLVSTAFYIYPVGNNADEAKAALLGIFPKVK